MWIRSQDKRQLLKPDRIFCEYRNIRCDTEHWQSNTLGEYSNETKAMKVLDMIQKEIIDSNLFFCDNNGVPTKVMPITKVFQIPSDDEVE